MLVRLSKKKTVWGIGIVIVIIVIIVILQGMKSPPPQPKEEDNHERMKERIDSIEMELDTLKHDIAGLISKKEEKEDDIVHYGREYLDTIVVSDEDKKKIKKWHDGFDRSFGIPKMADPLLNSLRDGDVVLDIGANVGIFSELVRKKCPKCIIYAFEVVPAFSKFISENFLGDENMHLIGAGLSNSKSTESFFVDMSNLGWNTLVGEMKTSGMKEIQGKFIKLDDMIDYIPKDKVRLIKIDTEGAEFRVFQGGHKFLTGLDNPKPLMMVEIAWGEKHPNWKEEMEEFEWLFQNGWKKHTELPTKGTLDYIFYPKELTEKQIKEGKLRI